MKDALQALRIQSAALGAALTGGLSIVLTFLPEIINLVSSFFKGKEAISQMTDKLRGFNDIMKAANNDTANQTAKLNLFENARAKAALNKTAKQIDKFNNSFHLTKHFSF